MTVVIDPHSPVPIFRQLHDRIVEAIAGGDIPDGTRLDPVRSVATEFAVNPATVKKAYDLLQSDGVVRTSRREGSVVTLRDRPTDDARARITAELTTMLARARCQGMSADDLAGITREVIAGFTASPAV